ncbi:MAG: hypothetical protein D6731_09190 [Planctomycetota bacterium]|nr:MAG: hypothetical protein D6731_09190 [Planctomycetota bacterium]
MRIAAVVQALLGIFCALAVPCMGFGIYVQTTLPAARRPSLTGALLGLVVYFLLAVFFAVTAVGAWRHRRWVRPVMLALSLPGTLLGVLATGVLALTLPEVLQAALAGAGSPGGGPAAPPPLAATFAAAVSIGAGLIFYVGLPGLLAALYARSDLQERCAALDPQPRWTDHLPLPVLGTSLWLGLGAVGVLLCLPYGVFPCFGVLLAGPPATALVLLTAAACAVLARAVYRRHPLAWNATLALVALGGLSGSLTFVRVDPLDVYRLSNTLPREQLALMERMRTGRLRLAFVGSTALSALAAAAFLLAQRRAFGPAAGTPSALPPPGPVPPAPAEATGDAPRSEDRPPEELASGPH